MRDIVKDAAIITVAQKVMNDQNAGWMSVESFIQTYATSVANREEVRATLFLFDLIKEVYEGPHWGNPEGTYKLMWINEPGPQQRPL